MEENRIDEEKRTERRAYDSFIYSLPFKTGAVIMSLVLLVLGIFCVITFMWLWENRMYSMTNAEIANILANNTIDGRNYLSAIVETVINLRYAVVPTGVVLGILYLIDI